MTLNRHLLAQSRRSGYLIGNFEEVSHIETLFHKLSSLLTLNK